MKYVIGDATQPEGEGKKVIVHVCNDIGKWGAGFTKALSKRWKAPEESYKQWSLDRKMALGQIEFVKVEPDIVVVNMIAQRGVRRGKWEQVVDYHHLGMCLWGVSLGWTSGGLEKPFSVHMPRIGCGLGGGTWGKVEPIIIRELEDRGIPVTVYDLPGQAPGV